jgi:hypothetical protein
MRNLRVASDETLKPKTHKKTHGKDHQKNLGIPLAIFGKLHGEEIHPLRAMLWQWAWLFFLG